MSKARKREAEERLRPLLQELCSQASVRVPALQIVPGLQVRIAWLDFQLWLFRYRLFVAEEIALEAEAEWLRAMLAHEIAHIKLGHLVPPQLAAVRTGLSWLAWRVKVLSNFSWRQELAADRLAAEWVGPELMVRLVLSMTEEGGPMPDVWSHPGTEARLANLTELLPDTHNGEFAVDFFIDFRSAA